MGRQFISVALNVVVLCYSSPRKLIQHVKTNTVALCEGCHVYAVASGRFQHSRQQVVVSVGTLIKAEEQQSVQQASEISYKAASILLL